MSKMDPAILADINLKMQKLLAVYISFLMKNRS